MCVCVSGGIQHQIGTLPASGSSAPRRARSCGEGAVFVGACCKAPLIFRAIPGDAEPRGFLGCSGLFLFPAQSKLGLESGVKILGFKGELRRVARRVAHPSRCPGVLGQQEGTLEELFLCLLAFLRAILPAQTNPAMCSLPGSLQTTSPLRWRCQHWYLGTASAFQGHRAWKMFPSHSCFWENCIALRTRDSKK